MPVVPEWLACLCLGVALLLTLSVSDGDAAPLDAARVAEIAGMLPPQPVGPGKPISDREAWGALAATEAASDLIRRAEGLLAEPLPDQPDDLFLEFSRTGNRTNWQNVSGRRRGRLGPLVIAECLEDQGRFIPALEQLITALCAERTWVMPAHDGNLTNFRGESVDIDLASSNLGWQLAIADWLLGAKLSPPVRELLRANVRRRILDPALAMICGERPPNWWLLTTNNWNAVCLAGVTGAALALAETPEERAEFVAAAEKFSRNFLAGFPADGYCTEGLGYWNYGFGHYVLLAETIWQATGGQLDLFALPEVKMPAQFGARIEIIGGVSPAFADCSVTARPDATTMWYVNRRLGLGLAQYAELDPRWVMGSLTSGLLFLFDNSAAGASPTSDAPGTELRTWFDQAGVLIGRPAADSQCRLGVALKGGHNNEHHNHNDLGSFVVVVGDRPVLLDPGAEVYTARTFSSRRYESNLLNSFGHPVPVVAGKLQPAGAQWRATVVRAEFTDAADTLELDLSHAYDVPELKTLTRTFVYSRAEAGSLTVTDHVVFTSPQTFETALLTLGGWLRLSENRLFAYDREQAVAVDIESTASYELDETRILEDGAQPFRMAIRLVEPVGEASITLRITPSDGPAPAPGNLLRNGGFEYGGWGWSLPRDGLGSLSTNQACSGNSSLHIVDDSDQQGSNVTSARIPIGQGRHVLRGQVYHVSGSGIGVYIMQYDAAGRRLNPTDERGNISSLGTLKGAPQQWQPFAYEFEPLPEAATVALWIHSYNAAVVEAYLDDLEIAPPPG